MTSDRCRNCGKKAVVVQVGKDSVAYSFCKLHKNIKPCSMCGSYEHDAAHAHPEFWKSSLDK